MWFVFALLSAIFAALTSILAKVGIDGVNSNLATAIRTVVVVVMAWGMVFFDKCTKWYNRNQQKELDISDFVWLSNRSFLAMLLQSIADWGCVKSCADR